MGNAEYMGVSKSRSNLLQHQHSHHATQEEGS